MDVLLIALAVALPVLGYSWFRKIYPHRKCRKCKGTGKLSLRWFPMSYRVCSRCGGSGKR